MSVLNARLHAVEQRLGRIEADLLDKLERTQAALAEAQGRVQENPLPLLLSRILHLHSRLTVWQMVAYAPKQRRSGAPGGRAVEAS